MGAPSRAAWRLAASAVVRAVEDAARMTGAMAGTRATAWTGDPSFADVLAARDFLADHLSPTPLIQRNAVSNALGLDVWLKCENLLPTAAFKVRGGLNLICLLYTSDAADERSSVDLGG